MRISALLLFCAFALAAANVVKRESPRENESEIQNEDRDEVAEDIEEELGEMESEKGKVEEEEEEEEEEDEEEEEEEEGEIELNSLNCPVDTSIFRLFPNPEFCNSYFICDNGIPVPQWCPDPLVFNNKAQLCDWIFNVDCEDKVIGQIPDPEEEEQDVDHEIYDDPSLAPEICAQNDKVGVLIAHEYCNKYYICDHTGPVETACPANLMYNYNKRVCDWPSDVDCKDRIIPKDNFPEIVDMSEI